MGGSDDDFDDFLKRRKPVFRSPDDMFEPPAELDRVVLRRAREAIESERPLRVFRNPRWATPVALAATLSSNYGIYNGFELLEHQPIPGREEYLDSEKYEIKVRDWDRPDNIKPYIRDLNRARRENTALQQTSQLRFLPIDDGNVIGFVKESVDQTNTVAVAIALSREVHEFWLPLGDVQLGTGSDRRHVAAVENLITGERYPVEWGGIRLRIDPVRDPAYLFRCLA